MDVNDAWVRASGYSRDDLLARGIVGLEIWADPEDRARLLQLVRENQRVRDFPTCLRHMLGELRDYIMGAGNDRNPGRTTCW